jgi:hypothetical protein
MESPANTLFDEIRQAVRWNRPSILVAVTASAALRKQAQQALSERLETLGQAIVPYVVTPQTFDIPLQLARHPQREKAVFFVSRLNRGGGTQNHNAFKALNMRRELLVDYPTRVIFWLSPAEAKALARLSPDFWAFRHASLEF